VHCYPTTGGDAPPSEVQPLVERSTANSRRKPTIFFSYSMSALPSPDSIPPLRSQPEQQQHPENIIDLTSDTTQNTPSSNTSSENMDPHLHAHGDDDDDDDDDDIIFTGENRPVQPPRIGFSPSRLARLRSPRPTPRNRSSTTNPAPTTNPIRSYSNLPGSSFSPTATISCIT
jgi:hypothetical protein